MTGARTLKQHARQLRRNQTPWEVRLWSRLRRRQIAGVRFLRQKVIAGYIVDFYAPALNLAIELDGSQHYSGNQPVRDHRRDADLESHGITIRRYTNTQVMEQLDAVLEDIERTIRELEGN